eukprot:GILK01005287.1.p1 GENE.GILK01005287.1~~GILK01005287.1.p1  ORF type:complete len:680 (+),score=144.92 GILK01005287.1:113-2152(+)
MKTYGKVSGDFNFEFSLRCEGDGLHQNAVLIASAVEKYRRGHNNEGLAVPIRCIWKRRIGDRCYLISGVSSNVYQPSADDIGASIIVEAEAQEEEFSGLAIAEIGPIELDPKTRRLLDNIMGLGTTNFAVDFYQSDATDDSGVPPSSSQNEHTLHVTSNIVRLLRLERNEQTESAVEAVEVACTGYGADTPAVDLHPLDVNRLKLILDEESSLDMCVSSRVTRDLIALSIRCFLARSRIHNSALLQSVMTSRVSVEVNRGGAYDHLLELERVTRELRASIDKQHELAKEKELLGSEKDMLEEELRATVSAYQDVLEEERRKFSSREELSNMEVSAMAEELSISRHRIENEKSLEETKYLKQQNATLTNELKAAKTALKELQKQIAMLSTESPTSAATTAAATATAGGSSTTVITTALPPSNGSVEVQNLKGEMKRTQLDNELYQRQLSSIAQDRDQLKAQLAYLQIEYEDRLKSELEEREQLIRLESNQKVAELQDQIFLLNSELDSTRCQCNTVQGELKKAQEQLENFIAERNRLNRKAESLMKDMNHQKANYEAQIERMLRANERVIADNKRIEDESKTVAKMYQTAFQDLQQQSQAQIHHLQTTSSGRRDSTSSADRQLQRLVNELSQRLSERDDELANVRKERSKLIDQIESMEEILAAQSKVARALPSDVGSSV